jgi:hypothetical protein
MNPLKAFILAMSISCAPTLLCACGPSQEALDATATQAVAWVFMTRTAAAPTATHTTTPTSTDLPQPTSTVTPPPTRASMSLPTSSTPMESFTILIDNALVSVDIPEGLKGEMNPAKEGELIVAFPGDNVAIEMYINVLDKTGFGEASLKQYVDSSIALNQDRIENFELLRRDTMTNAGGFPVEILAWDQDPEDDHTAYTLIYVHERKMAVAITYYVASADMDVVDEVIHSFATFRVDNQ